MRQFGKELKGSKNTDVFMYFAKCYRSVTDIAITTFKK